ncbi:MAG: hypothetical protein KME20_10800 [Kaiparowitsia implicata GSE-PSE-MK54-09C]|jgi:hypothetical protein|nr:hypothetical protein [Kaiparowitsia implicata GSE-PSE-MK54-09C]
MNNIWTIQANGRAVIAFCNAHDRPYEVDEDIDEAEAYVEDAGLQEDLTVLCDLDGKSLWDGESSLAVRRANAEEASRWKRAYDAALANNHIEYGDGFRTYLIAVIDPTEADGNEA